MKNDVLEEVVNCVVNMNDPKFINALEHIAQICQEKSDVLRNMQLIQNSYNAALANIEKCNSKLKELLEE